MLLEPCQVRVQAPAQRCVKPGGPPQGAVGGAWVQQHSVYAVSQYGRQTVACNIEQGWEQGLLWVVVVAMVRQCVWC